MDRAGQTVGVVLAAVLLLCWTAAAAAPSDRDLAAALKHAQAAAALSREGDSDGAVRLYLKAYDLTHDPLLLYNVARVLDKKGDLTQAREFYERYLVEETDPGGLERGREKLDALLAGLPARLTVVTDPTGAVVTIDGAPAGASPLEREVGAGSHEVSASLAGYVALARTVDVAGGSVLRLALELQPVPATERPVAAIERPFPWHWVLVATGGAALATGGVLTGLAWHDRTVVKDAARAADGTVVGMSRQAALDRAGAARTRDRASWALYGVGGAAVVTGIVLWATVGRKAPASARAATLVPTLVPVQDGAMVGFAAGYP